MRNVNYNIITRLHDLTTDSGLHWKSSRTAFAMVEILTNREESKKIDLSEVEVLGSISDVKLSKILQRKQEIPLGF